MSISKGFRILPLVLVTVLVSAPLQGQEPTGGELVGQRVRVTSFPGGEPVVGEVTTQRSGTLEVRDEEGAVHSIALGQVSQLERSVGGKPSDAAGPAALVGLGVGALAGVALADEWCSGSEDCGAGAYAGAAAGLGLVGVLAGVIVGSIANAASGPEQWTNVPLPGDAPRVRWSVAPRLDGSMTLGISLRTSR